MKDTKAKNIKNNKNNKNNKKQNKSRFSVITLVIVLILVFIPVIAVAVDMRYTYFRDNVFAQEFFSSDTNINDIRIIAGIKQKTGEVIEVTLTEKEQTELLKMLSSIKVKKNKFIQTKNITDGVVGANHEYVRIINLKDSKTIVVKMEGCAMEVQGYTYLVDDSLKSEELNVTIRKAISNNITNTEIK